MVRLEQPCLISVLRVKKAVTLIKVMMQKSCEVSDETAFFKIKHFVVFQFGMKTHLKSMMELRAVRKTITRHHKVVWARKRRRNATRRTIKKNIERTQRRKATKITIKKNIKRTQRRKATNRTIKRNWRREATQSSNKKDTKEEKDAKND